ncbi:hypothetical protein [Acetobacter sp.]|uniref:hypothetical protein n=1 Tax=Acetobacter sp. TaxID=440 RepID=UPI00258BE98E|nr:hypothetical protein [Acetobacter sp.]MCC6106114.1 hypothetical protein [Acetobacter sp.]
MSDAAEELRARLEAVSSRAFSERLVEKRGGGGDNGGMDIIQYRLGLLEKGQEKTDGKIDSLHVRVDGVQASVNTVGEKVSGISGRLDLIEKKLPNWWQPYAGISVVGAIFAALAKFLAN